MPGAEKVNLAQKLAQFSEHWQPRTVARLNDYDNTGDARTAAPRREL